jgi:hypothetical protein
MVVQGAASALGSDRMDVNRAITKTKKLTQVPVRLTHRKDGQLGISIPASSIKEPAKIFLSRLTTNTRPRSNAVRMADKN